MSKEDFLKEEESMIEEEFLEDGEELRVSITLDDDRVMECVVLCILEVEGREYIAVMPEDEDAEEVYLYRYSEDEEGQPELSNIETDEEYELAAEAFDEWLDEEEYDALADE